MKKNISVTYNGTQATVGKLQVNRMLPNYYANTVGPFVFLDYVYPYQQKPETPEAPDGKFAHPHRGIATFSYLFSGELEHYDSQGNYGIVSAGGAQWMNAGNGIIHDEHLSQAFQKNGGVLHSLQFWVNLPAKNKIEAPAYLAVQPQDIPEIELADGTGKLRVLIGDYEGYSSPVVTFTRQFIFHIRINPGQTFQFEAESGLEYAAFIPTTSIQIDGNEYGNSELLVFSEEGTSLDFTNTHNEVVDLILFGGEPYQEPIAAEGPFVMNSRLEVAEAYRDFFAGKYGKIEYTH
ncbi:pirin family protein [Cytophagaceae bacterium DM2B3-1]|uniref:Pirin family protein n=1 Tax=Xanthocytophaga flava TaxID=3048013 RepID=A0ABT7CKB9_9BACT|nr:pirin family protein [Xanthocytophaga flavus]MDJ1494140.1 pirin family protein [Xanthocytophaga flavus]